MHVQCVSSDTPTDDLRAELARLLAELDPTDPPKPANLEALLTDRSARLIVATNGSAAQRSRTPGACIGMLTLTLRNSLTRCTAHIDHVVVDPAHRRAGIAKRLVEEALRLAAAEGASIAGGALHRLPDPADTQPALLAGFGWRVAPFALEASASGGLTAVDVRGLAGDEGGLVEIVPTANRRPVRVPWR